MKTLQRGFMHILVGLFGLALFLFFGKWNSLMILTFITLLAFWAKIKIKKGAKMPNIEALLKTFETEEEEENWRGFGFYTLLIGSMLAILLFKREVVIPTLLILSISDAVATIAGYYSNSVVIIEGKTVFGTLSFFASSLFILSFFVPTFIALIVALVGALVELFPLPDDNIWIPLGVGLTLSFFMMFV